MIDSRSKLEKKMKVASLSVLSNTVLVILKIVAGLLSGSVSVISEAIHSGIDLVAAVIAFLAVKFSAKPEDDKHPYGHGKIENVSGVIEGLLIFLAAILIIKEAIIKIISPVTIQQTMIPIIVMIFSAVVNYFVSKKLYTVAKEEDSVALEADALHLKTDVYTSLGVGIGLIIIKLTESLTNVSIDILDPIVAILVAMFILKESWSLCTKAFSPLLDAKLSDEEEIKIKEIIYEYKNEIIDFHQLRTRKSGNTKFVDFHMTVDKGLTVEQSHDICERIESELEERINNINANIHIEPGEKCSLQEDGQDIEDKDAINR